MDAQELKALQAPIKERYKKDPEAAVVTLRAQGRLGEGIACRVDTGRAMVEAGLHPATGGSGLQACSGDMLLEALVACAGVTLKAVATALGVDLKDAKLIAEGEVKARNINVDTSGGVVTLRGIVFSSKEARRAVALAKETKGVKKVVSHLKVTE